MRSRRASGTPTLRAGESARPPGYDLDSTRPVRVRPATNACWTGLDSSALWRCARQAAFDRERRRPRQGVAHGIWRVRRHAHAHDAVASRRSASALPRSPASESAHCAGSGPNTSWYEIPHAISSIARNGAPGALFVSAYVVIRPAALPRSKTYGIDRRSGARPTGARGRITGGSRVFERASRWLRIVCALIRPRHERNVARSTSVPAGAPPLADVGDAPVVLDHRTVPDRRTGDRQHPPRVVPDHVVTRAARTGRTGLRREPRSGARARAET
jgi:hypothetical protein